MAAAGVERQACARLLQGLAVVLGGLLCACAGPTKKSGAVVAPFTAKTRYILKVNEVVEKQWRHELALTQGLPSAAFGGMEVGYWVNKKGKVEKMAVVGANKASPDLLRLTQSAIRKVKLPRMPADVARSLTAKDEGCLRLVYKAYISPPGQGGQQVAGLSAAERAALETRVAWNKAHVTSQVGFVPYTEAEKITGLKKETPTSRYGKLVVGRVKRQWNIYLMQSQARASGELDAVFYINAQGKVERLEVITQKGCDPALKELTLRAVRDAEIPPMPAEVRRALSGANNERLKVIYHGRNR